MSWNKTLGQAPGERRTAFSRSSGTPIWRPGQREVIEHGLQGRDVLCVMPTGGGKSLCYQLPGLLLPGLTLVVSPLIALMKDQVDALTAARASGRRCSTARSTRPSSGPGAEIEAGRYDLVYVAPERFRSAGSSRRWRGVQPALLAVDEAHCISEWGHDFRPDYARIGQAAERLGSPAVHRLTATATAPVAADIADQLDLRDPRAFAPGSTGRTCLRRGRAGAATRPKRAPGAAGDRRSRDPATARDRLLRQPGADEVAGELREERRCGRGLPRRADPRASAAGQERFMRAARPRSSSPPTPSAWASTRPTSARCPLNIPGTLEAYYQEAGRAGRDGLPSRAVMLAMKADLGRLVRFNEQRANDPELAIAHERGWRAYHAIKDFIYGTRCRRIALLAHFGDRRAETPPTGRCCDICDMLDWLPDPETIAVRKPARAGGSSTPAPDLSADDAPLFEALKKWRLGAAEGKPAYTVANNKTLASIAARRPTGRPALIEISGVGPSFVNKYADDVLALVAEHDDSQLAA